MRKKQNMPPNTPADSLPDDSCARLAAMLLAHQPASVLLFDADSHLQEAVAAGLSQKPMAGGQQLQRIDSSVDSALNTAHDSLQNLPALLPDLTQVDLVYIADPCQLASALCQSSRSCDKTPGAIRKLAIRLLAMFRDHARGPVYASVKAQSATSSDGASGGLARSDFFSLGFVDASREITSQITNATGAGGTGPGLLYRYTLRDYKSVPGWLNSKYWAHPERWNVTD